MTIDPGQALAVAEDIASDAKSPLAVLSDAIALYAAYQGIHAGGTVGAVLAAMDKDGKFVPAVVALADLAPTLVAEVKDPAQKARLFALAQSITLKGA